MDKIKALLLPLALIFAAIAVFETGARYGSTNLRAIAIANELDLRMQNYVHFQSILDDRSRDQLAFHIDLTIAAGSLHRDIWFLKEETRAVLDKVLAHAWSVRGDDH